jgi:hypothetical protein
MFKKLLITGAAAGLFLSSTVGAFATGPFSFFGSSADLNISNTGTVTNTVSTSANSGNNYQTAKGDVENSSILTGAASAGANVMTQLNWNQFNCGCVLGLGNNVHSLDFDLSNHGTVTNTLSTAANSGGNYQNAGGWFGGEVEHSSITTGAAGASSVIQNVVNTNMFGSPTP